MSTWQWFVPGGLLTLGLLSFGWSNSSAERRSAIQFGLAVTFISLAAMSRWINYSVSVALSVELGPSTAHSK